jgi:phosphinothricin acetyltransferase
LDDKNQITVAYCEDNNKIIGIALMCTYKVISGNKGWIEDVVVDSASRGKGIGRKLINLLVEVGEKKELSEILLFTEDHRLAAINLYSKVGFKLKESKIYCKKK